MTTYSIDQQYAIEQIKAEQKQVRLLDAQLTKAVLADTKKGAYKPSGFFDDEERDPEIAQKKHIKSLQYRILCAKSVAGEMAFALANNDQLLDY